MESDPSPLGYALKLIGGVMVAVVLLFGYGLVASDTNISETGTTGIVQPTVPPTGTHHHQEEVEVAIPAQEEVRDDSTIPVGQTRLLHGGASGSKVVTYDVVYTDGLEVGRAPMKERLVASPVNRITARGTYSAPVSSYSSSYSGGDLDCADVGYEEAQSLAAGGDPHGLDSDDDGEACEWNR